MQTEFELRDLTLPKVLKRQVQLQPHKVFLSETDGTRKFTYQDMDIWSNRLANGLAGRGVTFGTHVGILLGNSPEHVALFFALGKLGAVAVPVNTAARGSLLQYYFEQSDSEIAIVGEDLLPHFNEVRQRLPKIKNVIVVGQYGLAVNSLPANASGIVNDYHGLLSSSPEPVPDDGIKCSTLLLLAYTSGTTGPSKGNMLTQAAALSYGTSSSRAHGFVSSDVFYICLPLFHNNALLSSLITALTCGGSVALATRFSVSRYWDEIRESKATITNLLGAMSNFLWAQPPKANDADNNLRKISMSPLPKYALEFGKRFGFQPISNYGLSDFATVTSYLATDPPEKIGSIGRPRQGFQVRIVDEDDIEVATGEVGELVIRADEPWRAAGGYYKMPEATLEAHRNQWFHTGDRAYQDADGFLWFVDRNKDCIRRRGENISSYEVEQAILSNPSVANVAAFPVKIDDMEEEVGVALTLKADCTLSEAELIEHCQNNMAYFMVPRFVWISDELPITPNQKIEKYKIKAQFEDDLDSVWDREKAGILLKR